MGLRWAYTVAAAAVVVGLVVGGGLGFPAEDLVKKLPGQPTVTFKQYAGYVDVGVENNKRSLFYYFVEAEGNPNYKPLTLWLNGGPGCSSVGGGAFTELGPFYPSGNGRGLITNPKSWNKVSNLLFVESPVGVGWSYSNTSSNHTIGDKLTARDMFDFLLTWYTKFPIFRNRALFLTGESYAGHYIPQLADLLLYHNEHSSIPVNLKGIALGNPLLKLDRDVPAMYDYMWSHGLISDEIRDTIMDICDFEDYSLTIHNNKTQGRCYDALDAAYAVGSVTDVYGVIYDQCYPSIVEQELRLGKMATKMSLGVDVCKTYERDFYFNLPQVQRALHANVTGLPYMWSICTVNPQLNYNYTDQDTDMVPLLKRILESKIPLLIYSGDQDLVVPLQGSRKIVRELAHDMKFNITDSYRAWFHEEQVGGWVTEYGKQLTFATVRGASHMVPYTQSSRALGLFASFVGGRRLPNTTQYSH